ncbi:hypothetical protein [Subsaximicrobium wynnwilliamsii]|uniref:hypothetical protein n=1 Tax=Subsaximicrobium wynnwilliamsii TaxID=291179 RepID=UPI00167855D2|nr:hypothetical protein [Subsaximicrobium wynnwilliamsii]
MRFLNVKRSLGRIAVLLELKLYFYPNMESQISNTEFHSVRELDLPLPLIVGNLRFNA